MSTINLLCKFVSQRPGLDFHNYGDWKAYNSERREITKDMGDFYDLLNHARLRVNKLDDKVKAYLQRSSGRLTMDDNGQLQYITGQYFPTEYRPAAASVIASIIWADYRDEKHPDGRNVYETGHDIRKTLRTYFGRRIMKYYFN